MEGYLLAMTFMKGSGILFFRFNGQNHRNLKYYNLKIIKLIKLLWVNDLPLLSNFEISFIFVKTLTCYIKPGCRKYNVNWLHEFIMYL